MKVGDIIWQSRLPGGECLIVEIWDDWKKYKKQLSALLTDDGDPIWAKHDFPVLQVLHPVEGLIQDPSYYYQTLEEAYKHAQRVERHFQEQRKKP